MIYDVLWSSTLYCHLCTVSSQPSWGTQYLTIVFPPFPEQALGPTLQYPRMPYALTQYLTLVFTFPECSGWVGSTLQ